MTFPQDICFGLRTLLRSPLFTVTAIICIALGIGANAAVFPFIRAIVINPLPYPESQGLVRVTSTDSNRPGHEIGACYADFVEWRDALWSVDAAIPLESVVTVPEYIRTQNWESYFFAYLFAIFTAIALLLAVAGVYGVVAFIAGQRSREFGIRLTLGADPGGIRRMVLKQGLKLSAIGVGIGTVIAYVGMQFAGAMMTGVNPGDPVVYGLAIVLMGVITLTASIIPARRATRIDPIRTLQSE